MTQVEVLSDSAVTGMALISQTAAILKEEAGSPFPAIVESFRNALTDLGAQSFNEAIDWLEANVPEFNVLASAAELALERGEALRAVRLAEAAFSIRSKDLHVGRLLERARRASMGLDSSERVYEGFCTKPFQHFETGLDGSVFLCCSGWLPESIGNINESSWAEIWNSKTAQEIRASVHDRSYRFCNPLTCPVLAGGGLVAPEVVPDPLLRKDAIDQVTELAHGPRFINFCHDGSCNLACPTCRKDKYVAKGELREKLNDLGSVLLPLINETDSAISMTGSGDPFASQHFRYLIKNMADRETPALDLQTNGQLFDQKAWEDLRLDGKVRNVQISMDASTPETYSVVRRFGNFDRLMTNLRFMSELRATGRIASFRLDFVVQARNFRDIPGFIQIGQELKVDRIYFNGLMNWGTFTQEEFRQQLILSPDHPEFDELLEVLRDPLLEWNRIWLGVLSDVVALARGPAIAAA